MRTLEALEKEEYKGCDVNLEIALYEYGLIWKEDEKDITFIYGVSYGDEEYTKFDWATIEKDVDPKKEWDWADWDAVRKFAGHEDERFFSNPLTCIVQDLLSYYSYEDVFGTAYYPFEIVRED